MQWPFNTPLGTSVPSGSTKTEPALPKCGEKASNGAVQQQFPVPYLSNAPIRTETPITETGDEEGSVSTSYSSRARDVTLPSNGVQAKPGRKSTTVHVPAYSTVV